MSAVSIRPLDATELAVLAALHADAFPHDSWSERSLAELLAMPGSGGWLAFDEEGRPAGFLLIRRALDEAEVLTLGVASSQRRRGLGAALLDTCLAALAEEGLVTLFLEVAVDNAAARSLYETRRFLPVGRRPGYLTGAAGPVDAVVLARSLGEKASAELPRGESSARRRP